MQASTTVEEQASQQMDSTYSRAMKYVCALAFLLHVAFMSLFAWNGLAILAKINVVSLLFFIGGFYAAHRNRPGITTALAGPRSPRTPLPPPSSSAGTPVSTTTSSCCCPRW